MIILLDMDGVLANFVGGVIKSHNLSITHDDYTSWDYYKELDITTNKFWEPLNKGDWWLELEPYSWAFDLVKTLEYFGEVIFCTSPSLSADCASQKVKWLRKHKLMGEGAINYQIGSRKELNAGSGAVLIDDADSNCSKYEVAGGKSILFPQPWNANAAFAKEDKVKWALCELLKMG